MVHTDEQRAHGRQVITANVEERNHRIAELVRQGLSNAQVAEAVGVSDRTVTRARKRMGIEGRQCRRATENEKSKALEMLEDGANYKEVGRTLGRSGSQIKTWFPGYSLTPSEAGKLGVLGKIMNRL